MSVITIRGQLGSGAPEIGKIIADRLDYDYVDREIISIVSSRTDHSVDSLAKKEMPAGTISGRIIETLNNAYPGGVTREGAYVPGWEFPLEDKKYLESLQEVIRELAGNGSVVIRGRGSQFILKDYKGALHVLTVAPLELRIRRVMETLQIDEAPARKEIVRFDSSRREFIKRYFKAELEDPVNYDLVVNTGYLNFEDCASLAVVMLPLKQNDLLVTQEKS